ncbi:MAG: N-acetylneuraminate synthase family protein [Parcubacteria group bacterium]|nr:N-acetylneuraminate synthase family protein [Parcubacteria group bacterium]
MGKIAEISIGDRKIGDAYPSFIVGEIGLNHNGDINLAKDLINVAAAAGADAVKFQKRTPAVCVPEEQKNTMRDTPWGRMTYLEYRYKVEFGKKEYAVIDAYCKKKKILWFASPWDEESVDFLEKFSMPCYKIASASLTDTGLLRHIKKIGKPVILSTGMSTTTEIERAVKVLGEKNLVLLHTNSTYPAPYEDLNLRMIHTLKKKYPEAVVGYSGHETGLATSIAAVAMGASVIERHITLDRAMWGSDHAASLEPHGLKLLVRDIRLVEKARGDGIKRVYESEIPIKKKLRRK